MKIKDFIKGKKVVFFGDSITHNFDKYTHDLVLVHGENYQYGLGNGWVKMLDDVCHFKNVENFAVSGGCYANVYKWCKNREPFRHFGYQVYHAQDAIKDAEVIFVLFGANDYTEQRRFGNYNDLPVGPEDDDMSLYGGMNLGFKKIIELNPKAKVFVLSLLNQMFPTNPAFPFEHQLGEYNLAVRHMCNVYGFTYVDVTGVLKIPDNFKGGNGPLYSDDGLHPNHDGFVKLTNTVLDTEF